MVIYKLDMARRQIQVRVRNKLHFPQSTLVNFVFNYMLHTF